MRLLRVVFPTKEEFLRHYSDREPEGLVYCRTKLELADGEAVMAELAFPPLTGRVLVRAQAVGRKPDGVWLRFDAEDAERRDFALSVARGEEPSGDPARRSHRRYPCPLPARCVVGERVYEVEAAEDVSAGGTFVRCKEEPPSVGSEVSIEFALSAPLQIISVPGKIVWVRGAEDGLGLGFAVAFEQNAEGTRALRSALRRANERGRLEL